MATMTDELMTVLEVAAHLRMERSGIQRWCRDGTLPAVKIGKEYRIKKADLEAWYEGKRQSHA